MQHTTNTKNHNLWYQSSYDRGLEFLLDMWPNIKKHFPDAKLSVTYGWNTFDRFFRDNPERMMWKTRMEKKLRQDGVTDYGRVGKTKLRELRSLCGIWAYPTTFPEINCISALESQFDYLVPVTMNFAALKETVGSGSKVDGDIYDDEVKETWLMELFKWMDYKGTEEQEKAHNFAKDYSWDKISDLWLKEI
jgi:glycosyltransferase involved in cell wall biosynthesis